MRTINVFILLLIISCVSNYSSVPQQSVFESQTPQQLVNVPPTSKGYSKTADVIEERLSWDGEFTISKVGELKEIDDWYHGKCWSQIVVYTMNGITNKCQFFIKKDLSGWTIEGWEILD